MDELSITSLKEIRERYELWKTANHVLKGPLPGVTEYDCETIRKRVELLNDYKEFLDDRRFAEKFDSRSNLHSSVLEEFMYYLFKDMVEEISDSALIGKSHSFKDLFFRAPSYADMVKGKPHFDKLP